ncbi:uncharacterized protein BO87DRAFT_392961 [Aspergillus neoniger CBS 115656]|uniref:Uncharacterized protein n=1 Tax=Aspergillus neoniger (strain CBS 115656) TaxID=1448310 RepID=A0A318YYL2_ASPNB|nr:hypothetical protein BO87DRAFT_392961 [Aspergillus neoniger CBS 115656]PYH39284.1 hypothetical protein BO87DRAFT_392961 [Aspergillus neoniger CBS 115656]
METGGRRRVEGEQEFFSSFWGGRNLKRREDAGCQDYPAILLTAQAELPSHCPGREKNVRQAGSGGLELNSTAFAAGGSPDWVRLSLTSSVRTLRNRPNSEGRISWEGKRTVSLPITSFLFRRLYYSPSTLLLPLRCPSFSRNIGAPP